MLNRITPQVKGNVKCLRCLTYRFSLDEIISTLGDVRLRLEAKQSKPIALTYTMKLNCNAGCKQD